MRIVAGQFKGRALIAPKTRTTRPTSDRARESLFNKLAHSPWAQDLEGARVIDLFAGSGALGLEAVSRGAAFCLFVETDHAARGAIRSNIEQLGLTGATRMQRRSATSLGLRPAGIEAPFDVAFLDPPYDKDLISPSLDSLVKGNWLHSDALIVAETAVDEELNHLGWTLLDDMTSGAAKFWFLTRA